MGSGGGPSAQDEIHKYDLKALEIIMEGDLPVMYRLDLAMIKVVLPPKGDYYLWVWRGPIRTG